MAHVFRTVDYPATLAKAERTAKGRASVLELVAAARAEKSAGKRKALTMQAVKAAGCAPVYHARLRFTYRDWRGRRIVASGTTCESETDGMAKAAQAREDSIKRGDRLPPKESDKPRPLAEVITAWLAWGRSQGGRGGRPWAPGHAERREAALNFWRERLAVESIQDVTLPRVEAILQELQNKGRVTEHKKKARPLSGKTLELFREAIHALCLWAKRRGYLDADPLEGAARFDTTPLTRRRALTLAELGRVLAVIEDPDFRLAVEVASCTGYRVSELRALKVSDLQASRIAELDELVYSLPLAAEFCKGRKSARQPIAPELAAVLTASAAGKPPDAPLVHVEDKPAERIRRALKLAGLPPSNPAGVVDFHSLRLTYINLVLDNGATVKEAQTLARHSTPDLTMNIYGRARFDRLREIAEAVGQAVMSPPASIAETQRKAAGAESLCLVGGYVVPPVGLEPNLGGEAGKTGPGTARAQVGTIAPQAGILQRDTRAEPCTERPEPGTAGTCPGTPADIARAQRKTGESAPALAPDLRAVADAWPRLPEAVKAGILAMVKASAGGR